LESGFPSPGEFVVNQPSGRRLQLMNSRAQVVADLRATSVMYSTMTTTDLTLYRVNKTYAEILSKTQIRPLTLSSQHPQAGEQIQVVSGYWERGYSCHIDTFAYKMEEAGYTWNDSIRYSKPGCEVIGGTSGSPVIAAGTRTVIAINNTGNESGGRCSMNNPCEINQNGDVFYQRGLSYGQQTYQIYSCLNSQNELDLTLAGCQLPH
jgi:V8-like Glu-specific endopeptidase